MTFSQVVLASSASCRPSREFPAIMSGLGIFVAAPEAGARSTANPNRHKRLTSSRSSRIPLNKFLPRV